MNILKCFVVVGAISASIDPSLAMQSSPQATRMGRFTVSNVGSSPGLSIAPLDFKQIAQSKSVEPIRLQLTFREIFEASPPPTPREIFDDFWLTPSFCLSDEEIRKLMEDWILE
jgi:hypothetical protein